MLESIQTDIWVRFQRMRGNECIYCCADDAHGTPIMIRAQQEGISPETLIARAAIEHRRDYAGFLIGFDHYHSTHSQENRRFTHELYEAAARRAATSRGARCARPTTSRRRCSCRIATSAAPARVATRRTSTATVARSAARPIRPRT